jgi:hypothetical protein
MKEIFPLLIESCRCFYLTAETFSISHVHQKPLPVFFLLVFEIILSYNHDYRWRTTRPGNILEQQFRLAKRIQGRKLDFVQLTSPVTIFIRQPWFQIFLVGVGVFMTLNLFYQAKQFENLGVASVKNFRINLVLKYENDLLFSRRVNDSLDGQFALFYEGCVVFNASISWRREQALVEFQFTPQDRVDFTEFHLSVHNFAPVIDSGAKFLLRLQALEDNGTQWRLVGSSDFRRVVRGLYDSERYRFLSGLRPFAPQQNFDFRFPWPFAFDTLLSTLLLALGCLLVAACGIMARPAHGRAVLLAFCQVLSLNQLVVFLGYLSGGDVNESFSPLVYCLFYLALSLVMQFRETQLFVWVSGLAMAAIFARLLEDCAIFTDCSHWAASPPTSSIAFLAAGLFLTLSRERFLARCVAAVIDDSHRYAAAWERVLADPGEAAALEQIRATVERVASRLPPAADVRQRMPSGGTTRADSCFSGRGNGDSIQVRRDGGGGGSETKLEPPPQQQQLLPVTSLDQLYAQALGLAPALEGRCCEWAAQAGGALRMPTAATPDVYEAIHLFPRVIRRGLLKAPARAIEKALACYGGDASRLLDLCRCRLAFRRAADLAHCLALIEADGGVRVARLANTLAPGHPARLTAGFRVRCQRPAPASDTGHPVEIWTDASKCKQILYLHVWTTHL